MYLKVQEHLVSFSRNWVQNGQRTADSGQRNAIVLLINYAEQRCLTPTHTHTHIHLHSIHLPYALWILFLCSHRLRFLGLFRLKYDGIFLFYWRNKFSGLPHSEYFISTFHWFFHSFSFSFFFSSIVYVECSDFSNLTRHVHIWLTDGLISEENEDTTRAFFSELPQLPLTGTLWTFEMGDLSDKVQQKIALVTSVGILNMREKKAKLFP